MRPGSLVGPNININNLYKVSPHAVVVPFRENGHFQMTATDIFTLMYSMYILVLQQYYTRTEYPSTRTSLLLHFPSPDVVRLHNAAC